MQTPDETVLARMADGDAAAFAELYDRYAPRALGLIAKMLGHAADAEDVLQEVFWQVWCSAAEYDAGRASPPAWILMIARSRACDALRRRCAAKPCVESSDDGCACETAEPSLQLERLEAEGEVREALAQLPEEQRTAIQFAFYGGLTHAEIAVIQDVPLGTAKTRIRLGMQRLRGLLCEREKVAPS